MNRRIAIVTVARSDYGIYRPLLRAIDADSELDLQLVAAGGHLAPDQGNSLQEIRDDGFCPRRLIECNLTSDRPVAMARAMGLATIGFAQAFEELAPDLLVVLGDRFEMHAATLAAVPLMIPVVHLCGGSITRGALDDGFRHSITKLSHLHLTECAAHGERLARLGEAAWRIHVTGSLAMDNLELLELLTLEQLSARLDLRLDRPPLMVTFHAVTRQHDQVAAQSDELLAALAARRDPIVLTQPNVDPGGRLIAERFRAFAAARPKQVSLVPHLGTRAYFSLMSEAAAMVGNSSSGVFESASFALPVVNSGRRQEGRFLPPNVVQCGTDRDEIAAAIERACEPSFRAAIEGLSNPYGDGRAAARMLRILKETSLDEAILIKEPF